jgi:hypothetical protein
LGNALGFLVTSSVLAADKPPTKKPPSAGAKDGHRGGKPALKGKLWQPAAQPMPECDNEAVIEKALSQPTQMDFTHQPLTTVIDYLKDYHSQQLGQGFDIRLDTKALKDAGIAPDTPVTMSLKRVPLRSALDLMLKELKLTWTVYDDVLLVTTPDEAEFLLTPRVFDVADLVVCSDSKGQLWDDYDPLIDLIKSTIMPTTWDDVGGPGSIAPTVTGTAKALVISQTYRAHCEIADVLAKIRAVAKKHPEASPPVRDKTEDVCGHGMGTMSAGTMSAGGSSLKIGTKGGDHGEKGKRKRILEKPTSAPTPPLRSMQSGLMVDKNNIIWDHGKPVGIWGVDGSKM